MWVVAIVVVIAFQGLWKSAYSRSNMKPKSIPKHARKWIEELFCWFQVLRQDFMFLSFCIHLHACSFILLWFACVFLLFCIHFLSFSFRSPFMFICNHLYSCPFIFLSYSFQCAFMSFHLPFICMHFPFILHSCPFISFPKLWKLWLYGLAGGPSATNASRRDIAKVIAKIR